MTQLGEGLVYRGPFTYRSASDGTLTLESAVCDEGRLTPERALLYVRDHLGSVRAVVDGNSAEILEASKYGVYGSRNELASAGTIPGLSFRDHFTGKEEQKPDFGIPYNDHGARLYAPSLRRWMTPDPLSEKYYGISPYAYCDDNPLNAVDPDGRSVHTNKDGKVIVVFDDDNMGIYRHWNDNSTKESLTELHRHYSPNVGGEYMGEYWQQTSFRENDYIDFGSSRLTDEVNAIIDSNPTIIEYALKARAKGQWDLKEHIEHGSLLFGKYGSPQDAGNFAAGMFSASKGSLSSAINFGYGLYNSCSNNLFTTGASLVLILSRFGYFFNHGIIETIIETGEAPNSKTAQILGEQYYKEHYK